jgi:hypothetical protein
MSQASRPSYEGGARGARGGPGMMAATQAEEEEHEIGCRSEEMWTNLRWLTSRMESPPIEALRRRTERGVGRCTALVMG